MGLSGWFDILIASILIRGYLLPAITNFLNLSNKSLMTVSIDFPHHASLPGSREKLTLHQFSLDSLVRWSINYVDKGISVKDSRDGGEGGGVCCNSCCMNELN